MEDERLKTLLEKLINAYGQIRDDEGKARFLEESERAYLDGKLSTLEDVIIDLKKLLEV